MVVRIRIADFDFNLNESPNSLSKKMDEYMVKLQRDESATIRKISVIGTYTEQVLGYQTLRVMIEYEVSEFAMERPYET